MSTEPGAIQSGRPCVEDKSQTEAWIVPTGGEAYSSLCYRSEVTNVKLSK